MRRTQTVLLLLTTLLTPAFATAAFAAESAEVRLRAFNEVPALSAPSLGRFTAELSEDGSSLEYTLEYSKLDGEITQAHLHLGQAGVNGGIMIFLCSNLGNGPAGTQTCPSGPATITGTLTAAGVIGPAAQGIAPGEFFSLVRALRAGFAYANVHSTVFPGGEIRGQVQLKETTP